MKIEIIRNGFFKQKWSFRIKAKNGKILASSEKYHNKADVYAAIALIQDNAKDCEIINKYL